MNIRFLRATTAALLFGVTGCGITTPDVAGNGTVRFIYVEGGCWGIEADGQVYEPINLPEAMREDGLAVEFVATDRDDLASICMIGPIIELLRVEVAD